MHLYNFTINKRCRTCYSSCKYSEAIQATASRSGVKDWYCIVWFLPRVLKVCQCCICTYAGSYRLSRVWSDSPGSCITRGRQVARFRPAETIVPTGARLCARRGPPCYTTRSYMGQNGTERYGMRQKQNTPIVSAHTHDRRPFSRMATTMSSVLRLLQICKREPCFSFVDL